MKTLPLFLLCLAACGTTTEKQKSLPIAAAAPSAPNSATDVAASKTQGLPSWPGHGTILCNIKIGQDFSGFYSVSAGESRTVSVDFYDAFTQGDYSSSLTYSAAQINDPNPVARRNADFAAIGVYETDFGRGHTRWWGFALDITTLTLYVNNAINEQSPPIDSGTTMAGTSTDCRYEP